MLQTRLLASLHVAEGFDTDTLGTFTRDVPRPGTQLEAARRKARLAIELSGHRLGLGSEGSFAADSLGLIPWNLELLVLIDADRDIEVVGLSQGPGLHVHGEARDERELRAVAERAGFPEHGLVLRPDTQHDHRLQKGLRSWDALRTTFDHALRQSRTGVVFVENDLRAHMHPSRMAMIERAGEDLAERLTSACPACGSPGFGLLETVPGLPCEWCGMPTSLPVADRFACVRCNRREDRLRGGPVTADPGRCERCNP
ncbi:MAG: hypothetical protein EBQ99_08340 [Planctomycetes bacterium]|nr:hypothetical protein [Planctomycetota bacterium]